jgi:5-formyltetrahydrofolate cyclo-ligase
VKDLSRDVEKGPFRIDQPGADTPELTDLSEIEACVVPGIAFDGEGNRIGRGFGYYDRFLQKLNERTQKIGLSYGFQIVDKIYPTGRDARLDKVVTETESLVVHPSVMK